MRRRMPALAAPRLRLGCRRRLQPGPPVQGVDPVHPAAGLRSPLTARESPRKMSVTTDRKEENTMTDKSQSGPGKPKIDDLEINKETVQDLTEGEAEGAEGGARPQTQVHCPSHRPGGCQPSHRP